MATTDRTYTQDGAVIAVPADTDATVEGTGDRITLAASDRLVVEGAHDEIAAAPDSTVILDTGAVGTTIAASGASTVLYRGAEPADGATATIDIGAGAGTIGIDEFPGAPDPISVVVPSGTASLVIETYGEGNLHGDYDRIRSYASTGGQGTLLSDVTDTTTDTSYSTVAVDGTFGIYRQRFHWSGFEARGSLLDTTTDYVAAIPGGFTTRSMIHYATGNPDLAPGVLSETDRYSGPDLGGVRVSGTVDYTDGTSSLFHDGDGTFGVYRTGDFFRGADATGALFRHSVDYVVAAPSGGYTQKSIDDYVGTGAYGVFRTVLHTDRPDGAGSVTATILDLADGRSMTVTPGATGTAPETETLTSGLDGSGSRLATATVAAGTDATLFDAFTSGARFPSVAAEITRASAHPADFAATGGIGTAAVSVPADPNRSVLRTAAIPLPVIRPPDELPVPILRG